MQKADISTDYLVIGAGVSGLSFADELLTRTTASITIVDKRDVPGGHWNDSYPFVKLHQPSNFYGVGSKELAEYHIEEHGPNKGFLSLASGPEIVAYCHALMRDRLLPSGRVTYLPLTECESDTKLRGLLSGKRLTVDIRKKVVDATWYTNSIPLNHTRSFTIAPSVTCIPPNDLPRLAQEFAHYTVLGGGKTGIDTCVWLLTHGAKPSRLRWIIPNDYWYVNRAKMQPGPEFFTEVYSAFADRWEDIGRAVNAMDLAQRLERSGFWIRLNPNIDPPMFHAATVSTGEVDELRRIKDVVRQGYVTKIEPDQITLTQGSIAALLDTLYIDCTACALSPRPLVPIFQPGKITLQLIRSPQIPFSAALIAFLESLPMDDTERNGIVAPLQLQKTIESYILELSVDLRNRNRIGGHPELRKWVNQSRLDGFSRLASNVRPDETEKVAILARLKKGVIAANANMPKLLASTRTKSSL